eukprot:230953_1
MPENIINEIPEILSLGLGMKCVINNNMRIKYKMNTLIKYQKNKECNYMPLNVINDIPGILGFGLGHKRRMICKRIKFSIKQLVSLRRNTQCMCMPNCNVMSNILSYGLGINNMKYNLEEIKAVRFNKGYDIMPDNIINNIPEILSNGLGMNINENRYKYNMVTLKKLRYKKGYNKMPKNINNECDILSYGMGKNRIIKNNYYFVNTQMNCNTFTKSYCFNGKLKNKQINSNKCNGKNNNINNIMRNIVDIGGNIGGDKFYRKKK